MLITLFAALYLCVLQSIYSLYIVYLHTTSFSRYFFPIRCVGLLFSIFKRIQCLRCIFDVYLPTYVSSYHQRIPPTHNLALHRTHVAITAGIYTYVRRERKSFTLHWTISHSAADTHPPKALCTQATQFNAQPPSFARQSYIYLWFCSYTGAYTHMLRILSMILRFFIDEILIPLTNKERRI